MKRSPLLAVALCLALGPLAVVSCGGDEPQPKVPTTPSAEPTPTPTPPAASSPVASASVAPTPPPPPVEVIEMLVTPDPKPLPTIKIVAPANETAFADAAKAKEFQIKLEGKNWETGKGKNHFHLILDNHPYKPIYDAKQPVKLADLLPPSTELAEGQHVLFSFPSRATHESVKGKGAASMVTFWVGKKGKATIDPKKPMLVYSRPKGDNLGPMGKDVMIDFYLWNTTLEDGSKVRYTITGQGIDKPVTGEIAKWQPRIVKNLQRGHFDFKLELLAKDGAVSDFPLNSTSRHIKVDADAPMDPDMGMAATGGPVDAAAMSSAVSAAASASASAKPGPAPKSSK